MRHTPSKARYDAERPHSAPDHHPLAAGPRWLPSRSLGTTPSRTDILFAPQVDRHSLGVGCERPGTREQDPDPFGDCGEIALDLRIDACAALLESHARFDEPLMRAHQRTERISPGWRSRLGRRIRRRGRDIEASRTQFDSHPRILSVVSHRDGTEDMSPL
jgi:hypothetical protein